MNIYIKISIYLVSVVTDVADASFISTKPRLPCRHLYSGGQICSIVLKRVAEVVFLFIFMSCSLFLIIPGKLGVDLFCFVLHCSELCKDTQTLHLFYFLILYTCNVFPTMRNDLMYISCTLA